MHLSSRCSDHGGGAADRRRVGLRLGGAEAGAGRHGAAQRGDDELLRLRVELQQPLAHRLGLLREALVLLGLDRARPRRQLGPLRVGDARKVLEVVVLVELLLEVAGRADEVARRAWVGLGLDPCLFVTVLG